MALSRFAAAAILASAGTCTAQIVLNAHPGPSNNGGTSGYAIFFNIESLRGPVSVTHLSTGNTAFANQSFRFDLLVRDGTALGGPVGAGPGSSMTGWASLGVVHGIQGPVTEGVSRDIDIPDITISPGQVRGVALWFNYDYGVCYFSNGARPYWVFDDGTLRLTTGDSRTNPFTPIGYFFSPRALVGSLTYSIAAPCYPNCDGSTAPAPLNVNDFVCFQTAFAAGHPYANCDDSTSAPALNVLDFVCFMQQFAAGCQ